ncbi:MAG: radical SAM protein [Candidatus Bruticola sp.]
MINSATTISLARSVQLKSFKLSSLARQNGCLHPHGAIGWLVNAELGSWKAAIPEEVLLFRQLGEPLSFAKLASAYPRATTDQLSSRLQNWYNLGFINLNGRPCPDAVNRPDPNRLGARFLALHMTSRCSLRCTYCYNSSNSANPDTQTFPALSASLACRFIEKSCRSFDSPVLQIGFMGGEPLLAFKEMKEIVEKALPLASSFGKELHFSLQTNGLHFNEPILDFLRDYRIGTGISIDGPAQWHNKYRLRPNGQTVHSLVEKNFLAARRHGVAVSPLAVISAPEQISAALHYFVHQLQAFNISFNFCCPIGRGRESFAINSDYLNNLHRAYIDGVLETDRLSQKCGRAVTVSDFQNRLYGLVNFRHEHMCLRSPCGLGTSILALDGQGLVYACEEYEAATKEKMCLGHLDSFSNLAELPSTNSQLSFLRRRTVNNIPNCQRCWLRAQCGGGCTHRALAQTGQILGLDPLCPFYKKVYPDLMWILAFKQKLGYVSNRQPSPAN